jgi:hypothetical protein
MEVVVCAAADAVGVEAARRTRARVCVRLVGLFEAREQAT